MKKNLYLLMAAMIIAPSLAYGMQIPVVDAQAAATQHVPAATVVEANAAVVVDPATVVVGLPAGVHVDPVGAPEVNAAVTHNVPPAPVVEAQAEATHNIPAAPTIQSSQNVQLPLWLGPTPAAPQGILAKLSNLLRKIVYPKALLPTVDANASVNQANLQNELASRIRGTLKAEDIIKSQTITAHRRATLGVLTCLAGLGATGSYALKYGMPALNRVNGVTAAAAVLSGLAISQWLIPHFNNRWNQRIVRNYVADIKSRRLVDTDMNGRLKAMVPANAERKARLLSMIDAMTAARQPSNPATPQAQTIATH